MINTLIFIHAVIAIMLVISILLQKSSNEGVSNLSSSSVGGMGLISSRGAATFLSKLTIILAISFFVSSIVIANITNSSNTTNIETKINKAAKSTQVNDKNIEAPSVSD